MSTELLWIINIPILAVVLAAFAAIPVWLRVSRPEKAPAAMRSVPDYVYPERGRLPEQAGRLPEQAGRLREEAGHR
jgi:hypothetical protein